MTTPAAHIAIFGARGFIGKALVRAFSRDGSFRVQPFSTADADLTQWSEVAPLAQALTGETTVVITSAVTPDRGWEPQKCLEANRAMANNLAALIKMRPPEYVVFFSSIDVYGRDGLTLPLNESSPIRPCNDYATSKHSSERILQEACDETNVPLAILRLPGVYGPEDTHGGPVRRFVDAAVRGESITVYGDGEQLRDLLYVEDVPAIVRALLETREAGIFNAVTGRAVSLNDMLRVIESLAGHSLDARYERAASQIDIVFETPRIVQRFPNLALTPIETGLARTYTALKERSFS